MPMDALSAQSVLLNNIKGNGRSNQPPTKQRNLIMANNADALIAFWDGQSHGTKAMIGFAREKNLAVRVVSCCC